MADVEIDAVRTLRGEALLARLIEGFQTGDLLRQDWVAATTGRPTDDWNPERQFRLDIGDARLNLARWQSQTTTVTVWMLTATIEGEMLAKIETRDRASPLVQVFSAVQESIDHRQRAEAGQRILDALDL